MLQRLNKDAVGNHGKENCTRQGGDAENWVGHHVCNVQTVGFFCYDVFKCSNMKNYEINGEFSKKKKEEKKK